MRLLLPLFFSLALAVGLLPRAIATESATWLSEATAQTLPLIVLPPLVSTPPASPDPSTLNPQRSTPPSASQLSTLSSQLSPPPSLVLYLQNLAAPRLGTVDDATLIAELRAAGHAVVCLDFAHHPRARIPFLNRDLGRLRDALRAGTLLPGQKFDQARIYLVPSGHRLLRDIAFYPAQHPADLSTRSSSPTQSPALDSQLSALDRPSPSASQPSTLDSRLPPRTLAFDLIYPANPSHPTGTVLEFSCDNKDRFGNTSLSICSDTLLDAAATEGFAVAMADHPVAPPYKGLDAMPDSALKIKAAVRTLRATATQLGLGDRIVPVGFSRGSGMALMLVTTAGLPEFENPPEPASAPPALSVSPSQPSTLNPQPSASPPSPPSGSQLSTLNPQRSTSPSPSVQGAVILSGRFTYTDLLPDDHMIPRYNTVWGPRSDQKTPDLWKRHGALDYLTAAPPFPLFLSINVTESPDALHQMKVLRRRLADLGADDIFLMEREPRAHKVPLDEDLLTALYAYLHRQLAPPS